MTYEKNDEVLVKTQYGETSGTVKDRFIQNTKLEIDGQTLDATASAQSPVYLVSLDNGQKELISENSMSMVKSHTD